MSSTQIFILFPHLDGFGESEKAEDASYCYYNGGGKATVVAQDEPCWWGWKRYELTVTQPCTVSFIVLSEHDHAVHSFRDSVCYGLRYMHSKDDIYRRSLYYT